MGFFLLILTGFVVGLPLLLAATSLAGSMMIERMHPPAGTVETLDGIDLHYVFWPGEGDGADRATALFIHGATGNLLDQMSAMESFRGHFPMIFIDRPGHGYSGRGHGHDRPDGQARAIAALIARISPNGVIVVGHSFGGAVALNLAMYHPERVQGLVLLSPATHPWPGAATSWYYRLAARPLLGRLFAWTLAMPGGLLRLRGGIACVFAPNRPPKNYAKKAATVLAFRPRHFRANAIDVEGLFDHVTATRDRYPSVGCPTVILTGDSDTVVYEHIHSVGCAHDLPNATLSVIRNCGHKTDYVATHAVVAAIAHVSGQSVKGVGPLGREVARIEAAIAGDRHGAECVLEKPGDAGDLLAAAEAARPTLT
ncbi:alpha/beta fold hydrolase [Notoacmeibacter sp. MSK16QG-6]|uniref:alpha/beta fold hydrolase n=1 Tax=Notoacmeibacter sp. MSK16QG-6 TaxID=2957982 RepID=UPI0020A0565C|nr:alpha/beta hydrolase [Notoacmeibacter sp. MSK16QG-6]MCP1200157.1 alpha/beta hydrolase [Notoacmeibacter sp. MSK16QG-6]